MRKIVIFSFVLTCNIGTGISIIFAQSEIIVEPGLNALYEAVIANPGSNLVLKRGGDYSTDKAIPIYLPTNIRGETEPDSDAPAVIRFVAEPGEAAGKHLIDITADFSLRNVGLMGYSNNNQHIGPIAFITSKFVTFILEGCVIQGANQITETNGNDFLTLLQKNNIIFNLVKEYYSAWGGFGNGWGGDGTIYQSYNNTFFNCGRIFNLAGASSSTLKMIIEK